MPGTNIWLDVDGNWANAANWSLAAAPVNGDTVIIPSGNKSITTGLAQSAVTLAALRTYAAFIGTIEGLAIGATKYYLGIPSDDGRTAAGCRRLVLNLGSVQSAGIVYSTSDGTLDTGKPPVRIKGTHASNTLNILGGRVGVGTDGAGDVATMLTATVAGGALTYGYGVTWGEVDVVGKGTFVTRSGGGTKLVVASGCSAQILEGYAAFNTLIGTVNAYGSVRSDIRPASGDIFTLVNLYEDGTIDFSNNPAAGTLGTMNHYPGGTWVNSAAVPGHVVPTVWNKFGGTVEVAA
jgi:hypothetical protein